MPALAYTTFIPIWKQAPLLRFLVPLIPGIISQWYWSMHSGALCFLSLIVLLLFLLLYRTKYRSTPWFALSMYGLIAILGCWLVFLKDVQQWENFAGKHYYQNETVIATLEEPLVNKPKSFKVEASIQLLDSAGNIKKVAGKIIIYLQKDSSIPVLDYGSRIIFNKPLQRIKNQGNPGGFDYARFTAFKGLYYQVFLNSNDYLIDSHIDYSPLQKTIYQARNWMLKSFKKWIPGKVEAGLAEALLAGYKDDLDKGLVEQYASTGVVHIIAISGMHLGLIYMVLLLVCMPLQKRKQGRIISGILIVVALWFFSLLTGAAPSITRAAIMFTVIIAGKTFSRKSGIYNSLAAAAMMLLLYDPFNLWNIGFQLSFAAVLSIAIFGRLVTNWVVSPYKWLNKIWQLIAITIAAQILTLPLVIYHFHQFPLYFLLANIIAVPLSTIILYTLLVLLAVSWVPLIASNIGWLLHYLIYALNTYIAWVAHLPGATIGKLYFSIPQAICLLLFIVSASWWLMHKSIDGLLVALSGVLVLLSLVWMQYFKSLKQQKLIIYNAPQMLAVDIIQGRHYQFIGDTALYKKGFLQNFHLLPTRVLYQANTGENILQQDAGFTLAQLNKVNLVIVDKGLDLYHSDTIYTNLLLLQKPRGIHPQKLLRKIHCNTVILAGFIAPANLLQWKNATDSLHIRLHLLQEQGAFEANF